MDNSEHDNQALTGGLHDPTDERGLRSEVDTDLSGGSEEFVNSVSSLVSEEPRTVREVHQSLGEPQGLSRDQTEYRLQQLSSSGTIQSKKSPGRTGPQIFWKSDDSTE